MQRLAQQVWDVVGVKYGRLYLPAYMDFHLSCYVWITSLEEQRGSSLPAADDHADGNGANGGNGETATPFASSLELSLEAVDLTDAWDSCVADWRSDTDEALRIAGQRSLHLDLLCDSIFELIDVYTPTLLERQYVSYMRLLTRQITSGSGNKHGRPQAMRFRWHRTSLAGQRKVPA